MPSPNDNVHHKPRRAEPLQPDLPARGDGTEAPPAGGGATSDGKDNKDVQRETVERQREQSDTAISNVREGYK